MGRRKGDIQLFHGQKKVDVTFSSPAGGCWKFAGSHQWPTKVDVTFSASTPNSTTADGDLRYRALLLCQGIINAHDEHNSFLPFFYIDVRDGTLCCQHSSWALDDSIFRNISALARVYKITGRAGGAKGVGSLR